MEFREVFERCMGHEDGYVNNPHDPGGETKWGISKRSYPHLTISALTRDDAFIIYREDFWSKIKIIDGPIVFQLFDFAINSSCETAIRYFQRALNVADDGHIGPVTLQKYVDTSQTDLIMNLNAERLDYMTRLSNWPNAGRGWARRIAQNLRYGSLDS